MHKHGLADRPVLYVALSMSRKLFSVHRVAQCSAKATVLIVVAKSTLTQISVKHVTSTFAKRCALSVAPVW